MYNKRMKENFNNHALTYDSHADIQKETAKELFLIIKNNVKDAEKILEIGCGTGYLSKLIYEHFNPEALQLNDICPNMLKITEEKLGNKPNTAYIESDFEKLNLKEKYNLIISNASFQWFKDLKKVLKKIKKSTLNNGILAFSTLLDGTFIELEDALKKAYHDEGIKFQNHLLKFQTKKAIENLLTKNGYSLNDFYTKEYTLYYEHPLTFLKNLRSIGASHFNNAKNVKYKIMKKMIKNYKSVKKNDRELIPVTYKILYSAAFVSQD